MNGMTTVSEYALKRSKRKSFFKQYGLVLIFLGPFIVFFLMFCIYPLIYGIVMSMMRYSITNPDNNAWRGFRNFWVILHDKSDYYSSMFWYAMKNTVLFAIVIVPLAIIIPLIVAILINTKPRGYKLFRALIYLPSILPVSASGVVFIAMFGQYSGYINQWFGTTVNWLEGNPMTAWFVILLLCLWGGWGGNFIILSAGLKNVDKSLYEAASVDGCTGFRRTLAVTVPAIKQQLVLCLFTTIIGYFGLYGQVFVLTKGGPDIFTNGENYLSTMTVMYFMQECINGSYYDPNVFGRLSAMGLVLGAIIGCITGLQLFLTREKKSGVKISADYVEYIKEKNKNAAANAVEAEGGIKNE